MKGYKIFRWFLRASALTTVMFIMQACYGVPKDLEDSVEIQISGYVTDKANGQPLLTRLPKVIVKRKSV